MIKKAFHNCFKILNVLGFLSFCFPYVRIDRIRALYTFKYINRKTSLFYRYEIFRVK